jgi:hypothetical protein
MAYGNHHAVFPMRSRAMGDPIAASCMSLDFDSAVAQRLTPVSLAAIPGLSVCPCVVHGRSPSVARSVNLLHFLLVIPSRRQKCLICI